MATAVSDTASLPDSLRHESPCAATGKVILTSLITKWLFLAALCAIVSCTSVDTSDQTKWEPPSIVLAPLDSIGILNGDSSYMLSFVTDYEPELHGGMAILDGVAGRVRVYDSLGVHLLSFGRFGSGPGEFTVPTQLVSMNDSTWLVADMATGLMNKYDSCGEFLGSWSLSGERFSVVTVLEMLVFDSSSIVVYSHRFTPSSSGFSSRFELTRYDAATGAPLAQYFSWEGDIEPDMEAEVPYLAFTCDGNGKLFLCFSNSNSWLIEMYGDEARLIAVLETFTNRGRTHVQPYSQVVPGTYPITLTISGQDIHTGIPEYYPLISALGCDSSGNIWARRGGQTPCIWDVVSAGGEFLMAVEVRCPDVEYLDLRISPNGTIGCYPEGWLSSEYARVYLMEYL